MTFKLGAKSAAAAEEVVSKLQEALASFKELFEEALEDVCLDIRKKGERSVEVSFSYEGDSPMRCHWRQARTVTSGAG